MNILFIGYWGVNEGLTVSTIDPHLKVLSSFQHVDKIIFTTLERRKEKLRKIEISKVKHIPIYSGTAFLDKFKDYFFLPRLLSRLCKDHLVDKIICRSSPAGALGYQVWRATNIPFYVESFEPHAEYMRESGVWKKWDIRYILSRYWEEKQKQNAAGLMPVAENYRNQLILEGISESKVLTIPCTVDIEQFKYDLNQRIELRKSLNIGDDTVVGIYLGKYGGIYMDRQAFQLYREAFSYWKHFFLIILSPREHHQHIKQRIKQFNLPSNKVLVREVLHHEVPAFLSVSDFAYATIKPAKSRKFCSAIKIGEYWANGLPILLTEGVGDESNFIIEEKGGDVIKVHNTQRYKCDYYQLDNLIKEKNIRSITSNLAHHYRRRELVNSAYMYYFQ